MPTSVLQRNRNEGARLAALHEYELLDAPADDELEAVVRVAAMVAEVPKATLNLLDDKRQCQLTTVGFEGGDTPRSESMCDIEFRAGQFVHVPDATRNPLYSDNLWVNGQLADVRFYASAPLITPDGYALGTLCVFDEQVKTLRPEQISRLLDLADIVVALFERRRQSRLNAALARDRERAKRFIETVLETIDVGIAACDPAGELTVFNRAAREWHGVHAGEGLPPEDLSDYYGLFDATGTHRLVPEEIPLIRALREGEVHEAEMMIKRLDAADVDLICTARRLADDDGTPLGAVVAMNNVTADRAQRRALEAAHRELIDRGEQLAAAVTELSRSNDELEQFAGAVSHDLVRPMAAAHGYLEMMTSGYAEDLDPRATKWLDGAIRAVERMQELVQALLTYARAGHAPFSPEPVALGEVFDAVRADLTTIAESSGAEVTVNGELPTVQGDRTLIRQLLQNLIDNAMKYRSPDRACRIALSAENNDFGWTILVADNGIGIPPDQRERVFEMFAQVDPASRKGHGIGLSTCHRIIDRHNGAISIGDTPGGGTTIRILLPA
ncbi:ATP-binding protein [Actinoplanes sp. NPDC026619]|uniref:sensor histidine kinase n=1 Tax=Actinoplanes sp. NPDC026619 TaxID=3155798 RepID=UPI0033DE9A30